MVEVLKNYRQKLAEVQILFLNSGHAMKVYVVVKVLFIACTFGIYARNEFITESMLRYKCTSIFIPTKSNLRHLNRGVCSRGLVLKLFFPVLMTNLKSFIKYVCQSFYSKNEGNFSALK